MLNVRSVREIRPLRVQMWQGAWCSKGIGCNSFVANLRHFVSVQPIHLEFDAEALHACGICEGVRNGEAARGAILASAC